MATQNVQDVTSAGDRLKLALAIAIAAAGMVAYYMMAQQPMVLRVLALVGGLVLGGVVAWFSEPGRRFLAVSPLRFRISSPISAPSHTRVSKP